MVKVKNLLSFEREMNLNQKWLIIGGSILVLSAMFIFSIFYIPNSILFIFILFIAYSMASVVTLIQAFRFWFRKYIGLILHMFAALLYLAVAILFLSNFWITLHTAINNLLIIFILSFISMGVFRIFIAYTQSFKNGWIWTAFCGFINLLLAILIFIALDDYPTFVLIFSNGIDILTTGIALITLGIAAKEANQH